MNQILVNEIQIRQARNPECIPRDLPRWLVHDLLQPLNAYGLAAVQVDSTLKSMLPADHPLLSSLALMERAIRLEESLLRSLHHYIRGDEQVPAARFESVAIKEIAQAVMRRHRTLFPGVALEATAEGEIWAKSNFAQLMELIACLADNAAQNARSLVRLRVQVQDGEVHIVVADDGPGLPDEVMAALGMPFVRAADQTRQMHRGLGLGIYNAATLCGQLGHGLYVLSQKGEGCRFRITLAPALPDSYTGNRVSEPLAGARVALLQLDPALQRALGRLLAVWECQVVTLPGDAPSPATVAATTPEVVIASCDAWRRFAAAAGDEAVAALRVLVVGTQEEQQALRRESNPGRQPAGFILSPPSPSRVRSALINVLLEAGGLRQP